MDVLKPEQQYDFVLLHGAQHRAWCWSTTIELLVQAGHRATTIDLVSAGASTVDADDVKSFDHYNQPLYELLESLATDEKTDIHDEVFGETSRDAKFNFGKGEQNPPTSCWLALEIVKQTSYNSCSSEDIEFVSKLLKPVPILCDDSTTFTKEGYYSVPRAYIRTSLDKTVAPRFQDQDIVQNPPTVVLHLESDHSPFFSAPRELHKHLLRATFASLVQAPVKEPPRA